MTSSLAATAEARTVCQASMLDLPAVARLLAENLAEDPLQQWLFPDPATRLSATKKLFRRLIAPRIKQRTVSISRESGGKNRLRRGLDSTLPPCPLSLGAVKRILGHALGTR